MEITINIPDESIAGAIVTAVEQGIGYWASGMETGRVSKEAQEKAQEARLPPWAFAPLAVPGYISIGEMNDDGEEAEVHTFGIANVRRGIKRMARLFPGRFSRLVKGEADADDADIFFQLALFGEVRYG